MIAAKNHKRSSLQGMSVFYLYIKNLIEFAGGLFGVEKVKPDPLNLSVKTGVGK